MVFHEKTDLSSSSGKLVIPPTLSCNRWTWSSLFMFDLSSSSSLWRTRSIDWKKLSASTRTMWGATTVLKYYGATIAFLPFSCGGRHLTSQDLKPYRQVGDPALDDLLEYLDEQGHALGPGDDLLVKGQFEEPLQKRIDAFLSPYCQNLPSWVDIDQLQRGQEVFCRYSLGMGLSLYYRSLCAGFSIPKIAQVIQRTGYLAPPSSPESVAFRLIDTGALIAACVGSVDSLLPNTGEGWKACLYVRILHAKVRRRLLGESGNEWDTDQYGVPINQEDMAATLLAFSINSLVGLEMIGGIALTPREQEDYLALWRYLGWLLGVPVLEKLTSSTALRPLDPCGPGWYLDHPNSVEHASSLLESFVLHLVHPDESSIAIAHHLLLVGRPQYFDTQEEREKSREWTRKRFPLRALVCRYMIGNELADALQLPWHTHGSYWKSLANRTTAFAFMWAFRIVTWVSFLPWGGGSFLTRWYIKGVKGFFALWKERHPTRMAKALGVKSCCPFAMAPQGGSAAPSPNVQNGK